MSFKVIPINMISSPNSWAPSKDSFWTVTGGVAMDLWGMLMITDALGTRSYIPATGGSLQAVFMRGDYLGSVNTQNLTVTKTATLDSNFKALIKIALTSTDATNVISGSILFTLTEGTVVNKWSQNWSVRKLNTTSGF